MASLSALATEIAIPVCAVVGIAYSYSLWFQEARFRARLRARLEESRLPVRLEESRLQERLQARLEESRLRARLQALQARLESRDSDDLDDEERRFFAEQQRFFAEQRRLIAVWTARNNAKMKIKVDTSKGVEAFRFTEYWYGMVFMVAFAIPIFLCLGSVESFSTQSRPCRFDPSNVCKPALATTFFSAVSFLLGGFTSVLSHSLRMKIAFYARTNFTEGESKRKAFVSAFRSGPVMGFLIAANGLLVLYIAINLFMLYYGDDWEGLFAAIASYGLGESSMALLGRTAGGIYAKSADVSNHLIIETRPKGHQHYSAVICDVGDIVGDITGLGTDLSGSYAESCCAALVVASISSFGNDHNFSAMCYPLLISSMGILVCLMTTVLTTNFSEIKEVKEIKPALRNQLLISTILMTFGTVIVSWIALPSLFTVYNFGSLKFVKNWQLFLCVGVGLWAGLVIESITNFCTNDDISLFLEFAAEGVGFGLAFVNIPISAILSIFVSYTFASVYGIAVTAVGMLSTIATRLAISDNAKRVAKIIDGEDLRDVQSSSTTRATIGKGFAIESTSLVCMALFGAFGSRAAISPVDVLTPKVFMGSIVGLMLPKWFSAMTMKRVGPAALEMANRIPRESDDYRRFFEIPVDASFRAMIRPVALVMLTPLIVGTFLGVEMLSGVLLGSLFSVVRTAISASDPGAWEEAKKYIRAGVYEYARTQYPEGSRIRRAAEKGKFIGDDPLKDTLGPPLNILVQVMAVESLVLAPFFTTHGGLLFKIF